MKRVMQLIVTVECDSRLYKNIFSVVHSLAMGIQAVTQGFGKSVNCMYTLKGDKE